MTVFKRKTWIFLLIKCFLQVMRHSVECSAINRMLYDVSRNLIYAGGISGEIYVISCLSGSIIYYFVGHRSNILHISMSRYRNNVILKILNFSCSFTTKLFSRYFSEITVECWPRAMTPGVMSMIWLCWTR